MLVILEDGRVALRVDIPIEIIHSIQYECGMLTVNGNVIGVGSPTKGINLQVHDNMSPEQGEQNSMCLPNQYGMPIKQEPEEFLIKHEKSEIRVKEKESEEPPVEKVKKEDNFWVDDEKKAEAGYGFLDVALAGTIGGGITSAIASGLGSGVTANITANAMETVAETPNEIAFLSPETS